MTSEKIDRLATLAASAYAEVMGRARRQRPDGFTAGELSVATHEAWREAVKVVIAKETTP